MYAVIPCKYGTISVDSVGVHAENFWAVNSAADVVGVGVGVVLTVGVGVCVLVGVIVTVGVTVGVNEDVTVGVGVNDGHAGQLFPLVHIFSTHSSVQ